MNRINYMLYDVGGCAKDEKEKVMDPINRFLLETNAGERIRAEVYIFKGGKIFVGQHPDGGIKSYTMPGGKVEKGEDIQLAAQREALEEVGVRCKNLKAISETNISFIPNKTYSSMTIVSYVAKFDKFDESLLGDGPEGSMKPVLMSIDEAIKTFYKKSTVVKEQWRKEVCIYTVTVLKLLKGIK